MSIFIKELYLNKTLEVIAEFMQQYDGDNRIVTLQEFQGRVGDNIRIDGSNKSDQDKEIAQARNRTYIIKNQVLYDSKRKKSLYRG